tara:strand:- start:109 stop:2049 length:1941 start_codon:yes stop_codon:yes gene_type:complete
MAIAALLTHINFKTLEAKLYDFRITYGIQKQSTKKIALISIDDHTVKALNDYAPLPLDYHVRLLEELSRYPIKGIGYLVNMNHVSQIDPELFEKEWGDRFVQAAHRLENRGVPVVMGSIYDITGELLPPYPLSSLQNAISTINDSGNVFQEDDVKRRNFSYLFGKPTFHIALAEAAGLIPAQFTPKGSIEVNEVQGNYFYFSYQGNTEKKLNQTYPIYSMIDLINGNIPNNALDDKLVLIGTLSKDNLQDFIKTPYSARPQSNPKLIVHAHILDSVLKNSGLIQSPKIIDFLITGLFVTLVLFWVLNNTPIYGVISTLTLTFIYLIIAHFLFYGFGKNGIWLNEAQSLVGIFLAYYLAVPLRLTQEYKKRWDFQRQHQIFKQVEEMKTNFISLVTHDLKTPVARIQGLTEVVLSKAKDRLNTFEQKNLKSVILSTDELNRFISSILELTKIESDKLHIELESKDINDLIENAINRYSPLCKEKEIQIKTDLEPLFPIKIDAHLIQKVINNLIDNAIKYSEPGSKILISTCEIDDQIEISVTDQGFGMTKQEIENLFTRFYRAKNDKTSQITGTGLGLYLSQYFIKAHQGEILVESDFGIGSTFMIKLPLKIREKESRFQNKKHFFPGLRLKEKKRNKNNLKENEHV